MNRHSLSTDAVGWVIFALALGAGFSVAAIYYSQPLLPLMGSDLHLTINGMGLVPTLTCRLRAGDPVSAAAGRPP